VKRDKAWFYLVVGVVALALSIFIIASDPAGLAETGRYGIPLWFAAPAIGILGLIGIAADIRGISQKRD